MGLSVCIVGVGSFGRTFVPLFQHHPLVERIALCDIDSKRLAKALKSAINTATQLEPAKWSYGNQSSDWWSSWQTSLG